MPRPTDAPVAHAPGVTPDRLLFIGSGAIVGYGVLSHDLTISGEIARQVAQLTGRGVDADIVADPDLDITAATRVVTTVRLERYDAIVLMLGSIEVITLFTLARWRRELIRLLDQLAARGPASLQVVVVGVPPLETVVRLPIARVIAKRCRDLNRISSSVTAGRRNVTFVPLLPDPVDLVENASRHVHVVWAGHLAPSVASVLSEDAPVRSETVDERARLAALRELRPVEGSPDKNVQSIVASALGLFGAEGAYFTIIDADRQQVAAAAGLAAELMELQRADAFCAVTIEQSRILVVEDARLDPRFSDKPFVAGSPGVRFYAGYPIEAPDGHRIGSMCIIDTKPRTFSTDEARLLRELALQVQTAVWDRVGARPAILRRGTAPS